jgi:hypothetical protein
MLTTALKRIADRQVTWCQHDLCNDHAAPGDVVCAKHRAAIDAHNVNTGAETIETDDHAPEPPSPTERELNIEYLTVNEWTSYHLNGVGTVWSDPIGGGDYEMGNALAIQEHRDL